MWKVERTCSYGFIGEDEFNSFDSAKIAAYAAED